MKKLFGLLAVLVIVAASFSSCGPTDEELEAQRIADSIRVADSLGAIALADSLALVAFNDSLTLVAYNDSLRADSIAKANKGGYKGGGNKGDKDDGKDDGGKGDKFGGGDNKGTGSGNTGDKKKDKFGKK